jgi:hypothetical protein
MSSSFNADAVGIDIIPVSMLITLDEPVITGRPAFLCFRTEPGPA